MKKPGVKLAIIFVIGLIAAGASYYLLSWRPAHPKTPKDPAAPDSTSSSGTGGNTSSSGSGSGLGGPPPIPAYIGKTAYAKENNVKVLRADGSVYKVASKGEWVGTIEGRELKGGAYFYAVSGGRFVSASLVTY